MKLAMMMRGLLAPLIFLGLTAGARADAAEPVADIAGARDTTLVKRYEGSFIVSYEHSAYTDFSVPLAPMRASGDADKRDSSNNRFYAPEKTADVEGALTRLVYVLPQNRSPLEVLRNYQDELEQAGGSVLFECKKEQCGGDETRSSAGGGNQMSLMMHFFHEADLKDAAFSNGNCAVTSQITDQRFIAAGIPQEGRSTYVTVQTYQLLDDLYCKALNGRTIAVVHVLEPRKRDSKMVEVKAKEMASSIESTGKIALYGILFDTDKTDLKPESDAALKEIATLLSGDPKLSVLIVGHTDNQGAYDYNLDLSNRRARAVVTKLASSYGVDPKRLQAAGAGMMAPVASNTSAEGQSKNRRVEVVKLN